MNKIIIFYFLFFTFFVSSQNVRGIVEYGKKSKKNFLSKSDLRRKKENIKLFNKFQRMREIISEAEQKITFELTIIDNEGLFKIKPILGSDYKKSLEIGTGAYDSGKYYNNGNNHLLQLNAFGELFIIIKPLIKWKIHRDKKKIGNFETIKATTKVVINSKGKTRMITAWFAPKIPISLGPLGYSGLPGLILELEVYKKIYYVKKMYLNSKKKLKIKKPTKGVIVSEEKFQNIGGEVMKKLKNNKGY